MKKKVIYLFILVLLSGSYFLFFSKKTELDKCLDTGGCWDYQSKVCLKLGSSKACDPDK